MVGLVYACYFFSMATDERPRDAKRQRLWEIVFEAETPLGRWFDIALLWAIALSVLAVMLESVASINARWHQELRIAEWVFTILFTLEYALRIYVVRRPAHYIFSFYGMVDLLACLPTYIGLLIVGSHNLMVIRLLRLLRVFRVMKMVGHVQGANFIMRGLLASRAKITVFFFSVAIFAVIMGTLIYLVESPVPGSKFTSIPISIYYTIVTITTLGFGDLTPETPLGMALTAIAVLTGYAIIAVPTGIVSAEMVQVANQDATTDACPSCGAHGHLHDAKYCRRCGEKL